MHTSNKKISHLHGSAVRRLRAWLLLLFPLLLLGGMLPGRAWDVTAAQGARHTGPVMYMEAPACPLHCTPPVQVTAPQEEDDAEPEVLHAALPPAGPMLRNAGIYTEKRGCRHLIPEVRYLRYRVLRI